MFAWLAIRDGALAALPCFTQTGDVTSKESTYLSWSSWLFIQRADFWTCVIAVTPLEVGTVIRTRLRLFYMACVGVVYAAMRSVETTQSAVRGRYIES